MPFWSCFSSQRSPDRPSRPGQGKAVGEATIDEEHHADSSPFVTAAQLRSGMDHGDAAVHSGTLNPPVRLGSLERDDAQIRIPLGFRPVTEILSGARAGSTSVRFAAIPSKQRPSDGTLEVPRSRVRLEDSPQDAGDQASAAASDPLSRAGSGASGVTAKTSETESRAMTQLVAKLISRDINYRAQLEAIMGDFGPVFPKKCLENFLEDHGIVLPSNRNQVLAALYQASEDCDKIDGVRLLKDLDRAAFRRFAISSGGGSKGQGASGGGGDAKRPSTAVQRSDKSRIVSLVSRQLSRDKAFAISAGGDEVSGTAHLQELIENIDFRSVQVPVGTRAKYVPATDEPESFQVPVWSLRAMHKRKQEREKFLIGNDPDFKQLGQAGREALRKRLARRSMFQQQEIIASAVVAAARAAVEPSVRRMEHSLRSAAASRAGSFSLRDGAQSPGPHGYLAHQRSSELDGGAGFGGGRGGRESPMRPKSAAVPAMRRASQVYPASLPSQMLGGSGGGAGRAGAGAGAGAEGGGLPRPRSAAMRATHFAPDVESPRPGPFGSQAPASLETAASMPLLSSSGGSGAGQGALGRGGGPEGLRSAVSAVMAVPLKSSLRVGSSLSAGLGHHAKGSSSNLQQLGAAGSGGGGGVVSHMPGSMADYDTLPGSGGGGGAAAAAGAAAPGDKACTLQAAPARGSALSHATSPAPVVDESVPAPLAAAAVSGVAGRRSSASGDPSVRSPRRTSQSHPHLEFSQQSASDHAGAPSPSPSCHPTGTKSARFHPACEDHVAPPAGRADEPGSPLPGQPHTPPSLKASASCPRPAVPYTYSAFMGQGTTSLSARITKESIGKTAHDSVLAASVAVS